MKNILIIVLTNCILFNFSILCQEQVGQIGFYGSLNLNQHNVNFGTLPNIPSCCPKYGNTDGSGFSTGLFFKAPLNDLLYWKIRVGYTYIPANFTYDEYIGNALDINFNTTEAISRHNLNTKLGHFDITPMFAIKPLIIPLFINIGLPVSLQLSSSYEQSETLLQPQNAFYREGNKMRNISNGKIGNLTNPILGVLFTLNYEFILDNFSIYPEIGYYSGFSNLITTREWKINAYRIGLLVAYNIAKQKYIPPIEPEPKPSVINASIETIGIDKNENEEKVLKFVVEEFLSRQLYPLLPYIFFDENSDEIPSRYTYLLPGDIKEFDESKKFFDADIMTVYYNILNIIGKRMLDNPNATITISGYNSNQRLERNNIGLSKRRAEKVRDYLRDRCGIPESRMHLKWDNLPPKPTSGPERDYNVENQRVEIYSDDYNIIKPVFVYDTLRVTSPPKLKIKTDVISDAPIIRWNLKATQKNEISSTTIINKSGFSYTKTDQQIVWDFQKEKKSIPRTEQPLYISFEVQNSAESNLSMQDSIPVEQLTIQKKRLQRIDDMEIDEYRLIMFDFDTPDILLAHKRIIDIICENVNPESKIFIYGYTDKLGNEQYNLRLSEQRANTIKTSLSCRSILTVAQGKGETLLYNNDVPEGRFYNRTVIVRVETPVK